MGPAFELSTRRTRGKETLQALQQGIDRNSASGNAVEKSMGLFSRSARGDFIPVTLARIFLRMRRVARWRRFYSAQAQDDDVEERT
ncbi:MAG: hypothetical protein CMO80_16295 [Verrucomicrobiales bacterium]|nr:hypothetical protein [Verrucomicrobiales bacterium]